MEEPTSEQKLRAAMGLEPAKTADEGTQEEQDPRDADMRRIMGLSSGEDSDR